MWALSAVLISGPRPCSNQLPASSNAGVLRPNYQQDRNRAASINKNEKREICYRQKQQGKNLQNQMNRKEIGNLPEKKFRVKIVKMIQNFRNRMQAWIKTINFFSFFFNFILFFNFTILYWFCHISKWIHHRYICVPHPEPSSVLPPHTIPLGRQ